MKPLRADRCLVILSYLRKFLFIKGLKVAGTSIEMGLARICGDADVITPITPRDELARLRKGRGCQNYGHSRAEQLAYVELLKADFRLVHFPLSPLFNHMSYRRLANTVSCPLDSFYYVCAERNPYHKILSLIGFDACCVAYTGGRNFRLSLDDLRKKIDDYIATGKIRRVLNIVNYRGESGRMPDCVLRHESLQQDFTRLLQRLGIVETVALPHAKKGIMANTVDPATVFRRDQLRRINDVFAPEFQAFGYEML